MSAVQVVPRLLPAFCYSHKPVDARGVVLHWISVDTTHPQIHASAVSHRFDEPTIADFLTELNMPGPERGPIFHTDDSPRGYGSYHLLIGRRGHVLQLVPFDRQAWHAGVSAWPSRRLDDLNDWTEGWALAGAAGVPYTDAQYRTLAELAARGGWRSTDFVGHDFVARPKGRRQDPGPQFDWHRLREEIGR